MARKIITENDRKKARRNVLLGVAGGCAAIILAGLLFALISYLRITSKPPPPPEAKQVQTSVAPQQQSAVPVEQQLKAVENAARSGRVQPVQMELSPQQVTSLFSRELQRSGVEDLQMYLGRGTLVAQGKTNINGRKLYATIRVRPSVDQGSLRLNIEDAKVGTMPMPRGVRERLERELAKGIQESGPQRSGVWLQDVQVTPQSLLIRGQTTGRR